MKAYLPGHRNWWVLLLYPMLWLLQPAAAQSTAFAPAEKNEHAIRQLLAKYEALHKQSLDAFPAKYKKDYQEIAQQRWTIVRSLFDKGEIYTSVPAQAYLDALVNEIVQANPSLKGQSFSCYFSRSGVPNAAYMGMGLVVVNMGLLQHLQNESQVAFVLCHEIAHFMLRHSENGIQDYVTTLNSPEVQKELQQIKGTQFRKRERLENLLKELTFDRRRHSRSHELEADSLAFELLRHTRFDAKEALTALSLLDTIDKEVLDTKGSLQKWFNAPAYPFKKRWLAKEEGLLGGHAILKEEALLADSLKTHPDCSKRIAYLTPKTALLTETSVKKSVVDEAAFQRLRRESAYELIAFTYEEKNYTRSLYYTLKLMQEVGADPYLVTHVGNILNGFYKAQKAHQLSKYIDLPAPGFSPSYNQLLQFVQNLYVEDFAAISYHFLHAFQAQYHSYTAFAEAYQTSRQIAQQ